MKTFFLLLAGLTTFATASFAQRTVSTPTGGGFVAVSGSTGADGSYANLFSAFGTLNANTTQTGNNITVTISGDIVESVSAVLNQPPGGSWATLTIITTGTFSDSGSVAGPLIDLNGADNVTINGTGGFTIENTSNTATASTIRFINDATNNTVQNCNIKGSGTVATVGTIFFSTGTASGNDGNNITSNNITSSGANLPVNAIFSLGSSVGVDNSGNTISGNNISDYFSATLATVGINLGATGNSAWTITNNKLFQTATRIYTTANTHNGINIGVGSGYTITGNTIGFANSSGTGTTNIVGNTVALTGSFPSSYTTIGTPNATRYVAINAAFTAGGAVSSLQNNTIGGFALYSSSGATTANGILCGINVTSGNANIGTTTGNTIGATTGGGGTSAAALYAANTAAGGAVVGIFATSTNTVTIQNNTIGFVDSVGTTATLSGAFTGIDTAGTGGVFNISSNIVGNTTADNIRTGYTLTAGSLSNSGTLTSTTGTTSPMVGVRNSATGALTISSNTLRGWVNGTTAGGALTGILASGANTTSVAISSNALGTAGLGWMRYAFLNSGTITAGISATGPAAAATLSITSNDIRGITYSVSGTGSHTYINWNHGSSVADNVNNNTFTNLNVNTTGSVTFLNRGTTSMTATGSLSVSSNSIVTGFTKGSAGGTVTFFTNSSGASSPVGSTILDNLNNFSNVTLTGATTVVCWSNADGPSGGGPTKTITNNTFNNITTGAAQFTGISPNFSGPGSTTSNNTISNITNVHTILGINLGSSNAQGTHTCANNTITNLTSTSTTAATGINAIQGGSSSIVTLNVNGNTISGLSLSGAANQVNGMILTAGTTVNVFKNKICNAQSDNAGASLNGIAITAGTTYNIYNNLLGDLRLPSTNAANSLIGILLNTPTNANLYYNTVYLNATSTGAAFGSTTIFSSSTTNLDMRDNVFVNTSTPNTTGLTVAYRRSTTTLTTYAATSNNNDFYAGTPGASNLIFNDGTNSDQTIAAYKTRVASRDSASFTENPTFLSTTCGSANFLHIDPTVATQIESGGVPITTPISITDDFDGQTRNVSTPDVGADEFSGIGIDLSPPAISYTPLANTAGTGNRILTATIGDATAVDAGANLPRIYFKKSTDGAYVSTQCSLTGGNAQNGTYDCTIDYSLVGGGGVTANDIVQYFVVAQDTLGNLGSNPGGATGANVNTITFAGTPNSYSILPTIAGLKTVGAGGGFDYPDLTSAIAALNGSVIAGAVTFELQDAAFSNRPDVTEAFPLTINANSGSSSSNTVTIKPKAGQAVGITASASTALFILNGADYIIFDGVNSGGSSLTITNTNAGASSAVIWLQSNGADGATNNTVKNVNLVGTSTTATAGTLFGVGSGSSAIGITSTGTGNNNNTFQNCNITKTQYGIYSGGASAANKNTGNVITGNVMNAASPNNITTGGILANFENGIQITQNDISVLKHDGTTGTTNTAFGIALGVVPNNTVTTFTGSDVVNAIVSRNKINGVTQLNSTGYSAFGIVVNTVTSGTTLVSNNMISGVRSPATASDFSAGIVAGGGAGSTTQIYFNSVSMTGLRGAGATFPSYALAIGGSNPAVAVGNNIFYNTQTSGSTGKSYAIGLAYASPFTNLTSNYNDLFVTGASGFIGQTGGLGTTGTDRNPLVGAGGWAATTGGDANSTSVDPLFISSATNLHLQATSTLQGLGITIGGITTDFDGDLRGNPPDIGADEVITYTVSYDANGGTGTQTDPNSPYLAGSTVTVLGTGTITRTGYTFTNWNTAANGSGTSYNPAQTFNIAVNTTLYAQWTINQYTVTFDANGGTGTMAPQTRDYNDAANLTANAFTRTGYTFSGWNTQPGGGGTAYADQASYPFTASVTLYAQWTINQYTLSYDGNGNTGGTAPAPQMADYNTSVTVAGAGSLVRTGYTFNGWNTLANGTGTAYAAGSSYTMPASDTTLFAQWTVSGPVNVSGSTGANGDYPSLTQAGGAFAAINAAGSQAGNNIVVTIYSDVLTEDGANSLNNGGWTTLTVNPSGTRTLSGSAAAALINLNGASNVTITGTGVINGSNTVTVAPQLTISNTNTGAVASTIRFINGASNNTVTNCSVLGSSTGAVAAASGTILFSTSTGGANTGNTISNNNIGPAGANLPTKGVTSLGSASPNNNTLNVVTNNNIFDFFSPTIAVAGISLQANTTTVTVSNNRLYQTAPRVFAAAVNYAGITCAIGTGAGTATITGNTVGFGAANGTGTTTLSGNAQTFTGLNLSSASTVAPTSVQNNTVSGISNSTSGNAVVVFTGVLFAAGRYDVGTVTGNNVGSLDGSSTITLTLSSNGQVFGIRDASASSNTIANNRVGAITINGTGAGTNGFRGILAGAAAAASTTVTNNQVGASGAGAITDSLVGAYAMLGIQGSGANLTATGNTIRNMSGSSNAVNSIIMSGMFLTGAGVAGPNVISQNVIHSLSNNSGAVSNSIYALYCSFPAATANIVERNFVHSLSITSTATTAQLVGILPVAGSGTYKNNMVRLGIDAAGASITPGYAIYGMFEIAGTNNIYNNSVYVGGSGVVGAGNATFAFVSNVASGARSYIDNIFWNARSTASGTGNNYAIALSGPGFTSNGNDLYATGTLGFVGSFLTNDLTLAAWQVDSGQDANSVSGNPQFIAPTGIAGAITQDGPDGFLVVDLHIQPATGTPIEGAGVLVASVTNDFDGQTRASLTPTDIGADAGNFVANTPPTISAAAGVTRQQGSPVSNSTIATVNDAESGAGAVVVTVLSANPSNGVTISNIVNTAGTVTADVVASCIATNATFTLQASDGTSVNTANLTVTVTANTAPTLTYGPGSVSSGGSTTVNPATGPSDNGSVSTIVVQSTGTYTGTISVDNVTGIVSISNAAPVGSHTITIRATDNCALTTDATFTLMVTALNTPPTITAVPVSRQQGSPVSNSTIANVTDTESGNGGVTVTVTSANPSNGVTISNIVNTAGTVTADVVASCSATTATFTLQASDGSLTATDNLTVTVTANTAPTLSYNNATVPLNGSTTVNPATGPSDNGSVSTIVVQSQGTYTGTISVDNVTGIVSISNAAPMGGHTITIRATDNCGATTDATFTLTVGPPTCVTPSTVYVDDSWVGTPIGTDPDGAGPATSFGCDSFATIQDGVNGVTNPGTVIVRAGTYPEAVTVNKMLNIMGAQVGVNANTRFAAFVTGVDGPKADPTVESILTAAAVAPTSGANDTLHVMADNVTFNGFVVDGNNPSLPQGGAVIVGGINTDSRRAIQTENAAGTAFPVNNLTVNFNVIQNFAQRGVELINGTASNTAPATSGNVITQNLVRNFGLDGIVMAFNAYANVTFNTVVTNDFPTEAGIWVQDFLNTGTPHTMNITNNNVTVGQDNFGGIWVNLAYLAAVNINSNTVNAAAGVTSGSDFTYGIYITSLRTGTAAQVSGNIVGASGGQFDRGIALWNVGTSPTTTIVKNGTVKNSVKGISLVDNDANFGSAGASSAADVSGMTVTGCQVGVVVDAAGSGTSTVTLRVTNSTLSGNTAATGGGITSTGTGGTASTTVTNSTLSGNSPAGASILLTDAALTVGNSIFKAGATGTNISALGSSVVTSLGYNLSSDNFGGFLSGTGDQINTDPILGPLQNNGGPTFTHAPLSNSPAIDRGKDIGPTGQDQRGAVRPVTYSLAIIPPAGGDRSDIGAVELAAGVQPASAVSHKVHGAAGPFDINLPVSGPVGIECRGPTAGPNAYQVILNFANPVTYTSAAVSDGTGIVASSSGSGTNQITLNLTGVTDVQRITMALYGATDTVTLNSGDVGLRMGVLVGDTTNNGGVTNAADVAQTKSESGNAVTGSNFRTDVNVNGAINASDVGLVKSKSGNVLPP